MPIPDYQTIMLPLLRLLADGGEHTLRDLVNNLADEFHLTEAERAAPRLGDPLSRLPPSSEPFTVQERTDTPDLLLQMNLPCLWSNDALHR